jgi:hypothetical protein
VALLYIVGQAVEQAVEQERRRTEGEWRRIEDDLARMEEERLRERSELSDVYYMLYIYFCFLHEICELSQLFILHD